MKLKPLNEYHRIVSTVAKLRYNRGGVYFLYSPDGLQYIGESEKVAHRVRHHSHFRGVDISSWRIEVIRSCIYGKRKWLEWMFITNLKPPLNKMYLVPRRLGFSVDTKH